MLQQISWTWLDWEYVKTDTIESTHTNTFDVSKRPRWLVGPSWSWWTGGGLTNKVLLNIHPVERGHGFTGTEEKEMRKQNPFETC